MPRLSGGLIALRDGVRTKLWPLPTAGIVVALVLGIGLPRLDAHVDGDLPNAFGQYVFGGDAGAARTVLDAIAGSLITVTSLTFSLTVVTLQLASSQFSPRLLRTFTRDVFVQATLAIFLATFVFALTVLRSVRSGSDGESAFVPRISVTLAFVLAVASVLGLVLFLAHLAQQIRVETMLKVVHADAEQAVDRLVEQRTDDVSAVPPTLVGAVHLVPAAKSGFLIHLDERALLDAACDADAIVVVNARPGAAVVAGTPMAGLWSRTAVALEAGARDALSSSVRSAIAVGVERTDTQDIELGLRQLTDVVNKALSPGINDPTTAVHALGHSAALLCKLAGRSLGPRTLADDAGVVRVVLARPTLDELAELAVAQPRRYGSADPDVLARLFGLLRELGWCVEPRDRHVVTGQLARLRATVAGQPFDDAELRRLSRLGALVERALEHDWPFDAEGA